MVCGAARRFDHPRVLRPPSAGERSSICQEGSVASGVRWSEDSRIIRPALMGKCDSRGRGRKMISPREIGTPVSAQKASICETPLLHTWQTTCPSVGSLHVTLKVACDGRSWTMTCEHVLFPPGEPGAHSFDSPPGSRDLPAHWGPSKPDRGVSNGMSARPTMLSAG